ncbi:MAG: flagellar hook-associated protein FlgL [Liquorilactobacillus nagelii]|jgi:flagellar hook-associated protein 3 FlgL|uniref:Flagellar hook-associated protein 3 n=1 Tax=Liquorilactobacillus nagelii TaxID=82688 RepID=A0A3S6QXX1_9LACO|nr:flagellar hook-associated protein FlgL [Liquorilactobacillus nagelii]AUJ33021.1 flagellar hook-associated protein 3 [Liquorilactobacillus nagelii]MCC7616626.1 flagellar hook-associated protein 3 [Liquorilactobacillus nagelii]MCI1700055.1 flagellar hook-associated protein FlgL [Liquorilactobacillus nagelii]MCP9315261.1 flagellar hook-associated protein FlgL [Liquorilactobacillus nagelii]
MRIADSTMYDNFLTSYETSTASMQKTMTQLSSQKQLTEASDDPLKASKIINLNTSIDQNAMYGDTIQDGISWNQMQDSALSSISDVMLRMRDLIQNSANGTNGSEVNSANKAEIEQDMGQIVDTLNTKYGNKYIFAGENTTTKPFELEKNAAGDVTGLKYNGTNGNLSRQIADNVSVDLFADGSKFISNSDVGASAASLGDYFNNVVTALNSDNKDQLSGTLLSDTDAYRDNFVNVRTQIGALTNRLQSALSRNQSQATNLKESLSNEQDVDVATAYSKFEKEKLTYNATLAMGTKIMQTTILDYMY